MASLVVSSVFGGILACGVRENHTRAVRTPPRQLYSLNLETRPLKIKSLGPEGGLGGHKGAKKGSPETRLL